MSTKKRQPDSKGKKEPEPGAGRNGEDEQPAIKVEDRRHWAREATEEDAGEPEVPDTRPSIVDEYRTKAEQAETQLQEYIAAFKNMKADQEQHRLRLEKDVDRRVELKFGGVVEELLEVLDELDLALTHADGVQEAKELATGVKLVRDRFLAALTRHGVERMELAGEPFDPNTAEAMNTEPVADGAMDGRIVRTYRPGYTLGERVIRPARVAVGKKA